jgi:hypothetical protein
MTDTDDITPEEAKAVEQRYAIAAEQPYVEYAERVAASLHDIPKLLAALRRRDAELFDLRKINDSIRELRAEAQAHCSPKSRPRWLIPGRQQLASAPDSQHGQASADNDANDAPQNGALVPPGRELIGCVKKAPIAHQYGLQILRSQLSGVLQQLNFFLAKSKPLAEGNHLLLLVQQSETKADEFVFAARSCGCGGYGDGCTWLRSAQRFSARDREHEDEPALHQG